MLCLEIFILFMRYFVLSTPLPRCALPFCWILCPVCANSVLCFVLWVFFLFVFASGCFHVPEVLLLVGCILHSGYCCWRYLFTVFSALLVLHSVHNKFLSIFSLLGAFGLVFVWGRYLCGASVCVRPAFVGNISRILPSHYGWASVCLCVWCPMRSAGHGWAVWVGVVGRRGWVLWNTISFCVTGLEIILFWLTGQSGHQIPPGESNYLYKGKRTIYSVTILLQWTRATVFLGAYLVLSCICHTYHFET